MIGWFESVEDLVESTQTAIVTPDVSWTYKEFFRRAAGAQDWLAAHPGPSQAPVVGLLEAVPESFALAVACAATSRPLAPLSPRLTASELAEAVKRLNPSLIVTHPDGVSLGSELSRATDVPVAVLGECTARPWTPPEPRGGHETPFIILHTAGTTGLPKPVPKWDSYVAGEANRRLLMVDASSVYATASPFNHVAGIGQFLMTAACGAALAPLPRFTVDGWNELLELGVTHATLVPTMIDMLVSAGRFERGSLRVLQHGAAPMSPDLLRRAMSVHPSINYLTIYGQTEGAPITCLDPEDHRRAARNRPDLLASVGRAADGVELRLQHLDSAGIGEICARAPDIFPGHEGGWLHTGDLGSLDRDGYLTLAGRKNDLIIRGGENVYPIEVENVIALHPAVRECSVVGRPDHRYGERVVAFVVTNAGTDWPGDSELQKFSRRQLAGFKVPSEWIEIHALPRNAAGKVVRSQLAALPID